MSFELIAQKRTLQGSGASRRLRHANKVPGIIYGGTAAPVMIELPHNELLLALRKEAFHASVLTINVDGAVETVLLRDSQMHAYRPLVLHVDFLRVDASHAIHQKVPLHFINAEDAPGVKLSGGNVSPAMVEVDVSCLPKDLPAFIEVDLSKLEAGQSIHVSQIVFPAGVTPIAHGNDDAVVVSISVKKAVAAETAEGEAANALVASGSIIISQHADSTGAPSACEALLAGGTTVYCVGYNVDMLSVAPKSALTSAQNDWSVYYTYAMKCMLSGETIATDWAAGYSDGAVMISVLGESCAAGTAEKVAEVEAALKDGTLNGLSEKWLKAPLPADFAA